MNPLLSKSTFRSFLIFSCLWTWIISGFGQTTEWRVSGNANTDSTSFIGTMGIQPLNFKTQNETRMVITPDGKVGFGTKTPTADLTVSGSINFESFSGNESRAVMADVNGNLFPAQLKPSPGGNDPNYCGQLFWSGAGNYIQSDCYLGTNNQQDLVIKTAAFEKMRITVDGKVGILQNSPLASLHIGQSFPLTWSQRTDHNAIGFNCYWNGQAGPLTQIGPGPSAAINFVNNRNMLHIFVSPDVGATTPIPGGSNGIYILENGKVGIRNDDPQAPLHVLGETYLDGNTCIDGQVCARRVTIKQDSPLCWPDYVFAEEYPLRSLEELAEFVEEKHHLPGIPSAKEVNQNGLEVAEVTRGLVEKVEELTLYMIELKRENDKLKAEVEQLKQAGGDQ